MILFGNVASGSQIGAALGCGLVAGVYFAFSAFAMNALAKLPLEHGTAAMQSINVVAVKFWFLAAFLETAAVCDMVLIVACSRRGELSGKLLVAGGAVLLAGCFLVARLFNVSMNGVQTVMPAEDPDRTTRWADYVAKWTQWNLVWAIAASTAAAFLMAECVGEQKVAIRLRPLDQPALPKSESGSSDRGAS